ncbi:aldose 1-epimerase [Kushneria avicenniae]|uniref:Aldose 1-epimerase n=1 Tax=Kushneria avicenniae TaxID=402385 RepID=A0A1I1KSU0_9GAMM|nr:aldose epimerase family protein [Kushneria avicenniae]SFC63801.1 aldose 1-epimerase [Kushneria avicenniae]
MPLHCESDHPGQYNDGTPFTRFRLRNSAGMEVDILDYGATLQALRVPDRASGKPIDLVLGFADPAQYLKGHPYFGALVGRFANRLCGARFELDGQTFQIVPNEGRNALHGGPKGLSFQRFEGALFEDSNRVGVTLTCRSSDGDMGFPGELTVTVHYSLDEDNRLAIDYEAQSSKPTVVSLTNHAYFNLHGHGDVRDHRLECAASHYLVLDDESIPTGTIAPVDDTPYDFRAPATPRAREQIECEQLWHAGGHDVALVLDRVARDQPLATLVEPESGRQLTVFTDQPSLQLYTGIGLDGTLSDHEGRPIKAFGGLALEAQQFPDAPNHAHFPSTRLEPGEYYRQHTCYRLTF